MSKKKKDKKDKSEKGFKGFAKRAGKSMENLGTLSGKGPGMHMPSSYYKDTEKAINKSKKKRSIPSYYTYTNKY